MRYYPNYFDDFFNDTKKQDTNTVLRTDIYEKDGYYQICMEVCGCLLYTSDAADE